MIVQCHGHFDLLHPGHIAHLKSADTLLWNNRFGRNGLLIVTLTSGRWMTKPGHPIFTDSERLEMIRSLRFVDFVYIVDSPGAIPAIEMVKPDIYVKGIEYQGKLPEEQYCRDHGIEVKFIGRKIYGSTTLAKQTGFFQPA